VILYEFSCDWLIHIDITIRARIKINKAFNLMPNCVKTVVVIRTANTTEIGKEHFQLK